MARDALKRIVGESEAEFRSRLIRHKQNERDKDAPLITPEAARHGDYHRDFVTDVDEGTKAWTLVNRGGDSVARWKKAGKLSPNQIAAIELCEKLWQTAWQPPQLTAQYGERIPGSGNQELRNLFQTDAREALKRIENYFPGKTRDYWCVFENIVRHGQPANIAGMTIGETSRASSDRALLTVQFVSNFVAAMEGL